MSITTFPITLDGKLINHGYPPWEKKRKKKKKCYTIHGSLNNALLISLYRKCQLTASHEMLRGEDKKYTQTGIRALLQSKDSAESSEETEGRASNSSSVTGRNAAGAATLAAGTRARSSTGGGSSVSLGGGSVAGVGSNGDSGGLLGDAGEDGGDTGGACDGGVDADGDGAGGGSSRGSCRLARAGCLCELLAGLGGSGLGLEEVLSLAGLGQARGDDGEELLLEIGGALAGGVLELAAGLGDVLLETFEL